ncbi:hypothetical protein ACIBI9_64500 [Nonomuraea sp. NPDC050451]|uniref:hypothetical protein n=1 Tax=Nonomuraea sp. NPDC050451 TaxID=3364364 RepID=UPI003794E308
MAGKATHGHPPPPWLLTCGDRVRSRLGSATGLIGHVLAELADHVLPALTSATRLLNKQDPAEADNFGSTVIVAVEAAARTHQGRPSPTLADMIRKITAALDAA